MVKKTKKKKRKQNRVKFQAIYKTKTNPDQNIPELLLTLLNIRYVRAVAADELFGKLFALVESLRPYFNSVLQVVKLVLQDLHRKIKTN